MAIRFLQIIIAILLFVSCESNKKNDNSINGVWQSIGYGKILKITSDQFQLYDVTQISCLPIEQGNLSNLGSHLNVNNGVLSISKGLNIYQYTKVDALPQLCIEKLSEKKRIDPIYNFEVFSKTIEEHFAYFDGNNIKWDSLYDLSRAKINSATSDPELFMVMEDIITALKDNHGYIEPTDMVYEEAEKLRPQNEETGSEEKLIWYGDIRISNMVAQQFLGDKVLGEAREIIWGKTNGNLGYIHIKAMWLYADLNLSDSLVKENGYVNTYVDAFNKLNENVYIEKEREAASQLMKKIMNDLKKTSAIVIDVRFNGGGQDVVSLEILKRFNNKKIQVATKKAVNGIGFTTEVPIYVGATDRPYLKPVYLLTSPQTASAADIISMASMHLVNIKRIGSHTNGALSDAFERKLPNGWEFSTSNELYLDLNGKCYEYIGIPVDYELNYSDDRQAFFRSVADDLESDKKNILNAIDELMNNKRPTTQNK